MILADTSDWIEMLAGRHAPLVEQVRREQVLMHPWVLGELSLGTLSDRDANLTRFSLLSEAPIIEERLVLKFIDCYHLFGKGLGWVDCQLLASAKAMQVNLWSHDKVLNLAWAKIFRS